MDMLRLSHLDKAGALLKVKNDLSETCFFRTYVLENFVFVVICCGLTYFICFN